MPASAPPVSHPACTGCTPGTRFRSPGHSQAPTSTKTDKHRRRPQLGTGRLSVPFQTRVGSVPYPKRPLLSSVSLPKWLQEGVGRRNSVFLAVFLPKHGTMLNTRTRVAAASPNAPARGGGGCPRQPPEREVGRGGPGAEGRIEATLFPFAGAPAVSVRLGKFYSLPP